MVPGKPNKSLQTGAAWSSVQWYGEQVLVGDRAHDAQCYTKGEARSNLIPKKHSDPSGVRVLQPYHLLLLLLTRERDYRTVWGASHRGYSGKWGCIGYVTIFLYACACSTGQINCANFSYSPSENWLRHFTSHLHRKEYHFLSRLLFSLPLFIRRGISNWGPDTQILLIYF